MIFAVIIVYLRSVNSELAFLATIASGVIIICFALEYLSQVYSFFEQIVNVSGLDVDTLKIILKVVAIAYLIEFGADTLIDFGLKNLADKLVFTGKIMILLTSLPVFYSVFNILIGVLQ